MSDLTRLHTMDLFSRFFQENREKFLTFAYSYLRDRAEAEDVLMESMITLWENRDRWEEDSNLHALLLTIIKNKSLNILEHKQIRLRAEEDINSHSQRELSLRISTLKACEPEQIFDNEIQHIVHKALEQADSRATAHLPENRRGTYHQSLAHTTSGAKGLPGFHTPVNVKITFIQKKFHFPIGLPPSRRLYMQRGHRGPPYNQAIRL